MTTLTVGTSDPELEKRLSAELDAFNATAIGSDDETPLSVRLTDDTGALVGGLTGWTWGGCGGITSLWLDREHRGAGWGSRLLAAAEEEIRRRGCTRVVATMSFQAPGCYARHGYVEVGRTPDMPGDTAKHHFHKRLDAPPRLRLVAIVDAAADVAEVVRGYEDRVLALLGRHGGRLEERLFGADGRTEVQTISFADEAGYRGFLSDPLRAAYREEIGDAAPEARVVWLS
jgi:GNAT superfamily N-acetyltransferase